MPWCSLRRLGKRQRAGNSLAAACRLKAAPSSCPTGMVGVPLTGHVVPLGRVADEILGQCPGTGGTGGWGPPEDDSGGIPGAGVDADGHGQ